MASTRIYRSISSSGTTTKATFSAWVKRSGLAEAFLFYSIENANNNFRIRFNPEVLNIEVKQGSSNIGVLNTNRVFKDTSAWYHIVVALDSTQSTADDRMKLYVNGVQETSFQSRTNPSQNANMSVNEAGTQYIGSQDSSNYLDGSLTHVHYTDGYTYAASDFGETDSTSGIWKPKVAPTGITYGTNGFFLKFENSGNMDLDSSGNNLSFTTSGTLTQNVDTPSNNFNTLNPNGYSTSGVSLAHGNTSFNSGSSVSYGFAVPSFALNKGKWYYEYKLGHTCAAGYIGDTHQVQERVRNSTAIGTSSQEFAWEGNGYIKTNGGQSAYGSSASANNIIGMFIDLDNNKLYISINGTIQNSGTGYSITDPDSLDSGYYYIGGISDQCSATANVTAEMNYGGGKFGVTAISSAQADANGEGIFEYSPNDGGASSFDGAAKNFYALNTKNIKEFG
mgnify:CR=1 FL=1